MNKRLTEENVSHAEKVYSEINKLRIKGCNWIDGGGQSNFSIDIGVVRIPLTSAKAKELEDRCGIEFVVQLSDAYKQG